MASSIFGDHSGSSVMQAIAQMRALGDPLQAFGALYQSNPQFRQFADSVRGKTPQQAFAEHGLDFTQVSSLLK